jgi:hypothetical protein
VADDLGCNLAMPQRRRIEMNFRLKCWPLARSADQVNDLGLDGLNISLIPINRVHMTPNVKGCRRISVAPSLSVIAALTFRVPTEPQAGADTLLGHADVNRIVVYACDIKLGQI